MTKRRTEITIETERLLVAHSRRTTRVLCARCGMEVEEAAPLAGETPAGFEPCEARGPDETEEDPHHS